MALEACTTGSAGGLHATVAEQDLPAGPLQTQDHPQDWSEAASLDDAVLTLQSPITQNMFVHAIAAQDVQSQGHGQTDSATLHQIPVYLSGQF